MKEDKFKLTIKSNDFISTRAEKHYPPPLQLEPIHQTIKLKFDLENKMVEGSVVTLIKANVADGNHIELDAMDMLIQNIKGASSWNYDGKKIRVSWKTPFKKGEERELTIDYQLDEPISGMYFSYPDAKYPDRPTYVITDTESERARYWLPCIDHPAIRCKLDFFLTSKKEHIILANGELMEETEHTNGTKTVHWKLDYPCPSYLITIAIGDFIFYKDRTADIGFGKIPITYYTTKQYTPEDLKRSFDRTPKMLEWFWKKLNVPLPWPKYDQIATRLHLGAMENISLVTWSDRAILDEFLAKERTFGIDATNVHEMAHSWFGDMVVIREFTHAWLKESWAVYIETVFYEDEYGKTSDEVYYDLYLNAKSYFQESDTKYARPIVTNHYDHSWAMYDSHLYPGGAWRIHMIRQIVGDDAFWVAVKDYLQSYEGKVVETVDFQRKLEEHSGLSLEKFFEQWLYTPGYPKLKVEFEYDEKTQLVSLTIGQTQIDDDDKKKIGTFSFPLEVMWETEEGKFGQETFQVKEKDHIFYFKSEKKPIQIRIDPAYKVLFSLDFNPGFDMLIRQLKTANLIGRIQASYELAKDGKKKGIEAIVETYRKETFWGVKREFARALTKFPSFHAVEALISLLEEEEDSMVLSFLISTVEELRDEVVAKGMKKFLERDDILYIATANALKVLGSQRTKDAYNYLVEYKIKHDHRNIIRSGLYEAIGTTRLKEALDYLLERLPYGAEPEDARIGIIQGIINATGWADKPQKERAIETLTDILKKETDFLTLVYVARGLAQLKEPSAIPAIIGLKAKIGEQSHHSLDRMISSIQKGATPDEEQKKIR
ncbi:MAG: M1 family aminopeptidase, partial [Candidatus Hodarchaeota archaeon]